MGWSKLSNHRHFPFPTYTSWSIFPCFSFVLSFICPASVCLFRHLLSFFFWDTTCSVPLARSSSRYFVAFFFGFLILAGSWGYIWVSHLQVLVRTVGEIQGGLFHFYMAQQQRGDAAMQPPLSSALTGLLFLFLFSSLLLDGIQNWLNTIPPLEKEKNLPPHPPPPSDTRQTLASGFLPLRCWGKFPLLFSLSYG